MTTRRKMPGGWILRTPKRGPNGRGICRWCGLEVPKGRRTFCGESCVHEWRLRTDPAYLREQVFSRDGGICALCGLDTVAFFRRFKALAPSKRKRLARRLDIHTGRTSFWDADHILPVAEGGGECDLVNLRTLCVWCHQEQTNALQRRLATRKQRRRRKV